MPKSAARKKLVLSRETLRALSAAKGTVPGFITTRGPTEVYTYCMIDCATETEYCTAG